MKKGEILFCSYDFVNELNQNYLNEFDIKLQIVRYSNKGLKHGFKQIKDLAPSEGLFSKTMNRWKRLRFTTEEKEQMRCGKTGTWYDLYELEFLKEMESYKFQRCYNRIKFYLDRGINVIAICYCSDFEKCHRKLIANKLKEEGYNVTLK